MNLVPPPTVDGAAGIGEGRRCVELLGAFLGRFAEVYTADELSWEERARGTWLSVAATIGRLVEATTTTGRAVRGRAVGIDDFGGLRLSTDAGEVSVAFGDVIHLRERLRRVAAGPALRSRPWRSRNDS